MALQKITDAQMDAAGVAAAPDILEGSPATVKAIFDRLVRSVVATAFNALADQLTAAGVESLVQHGTDSIKYIRLNADGAIETSADGSTWTVTGSSGHLIYDKDGNFITQRARMKFANATVTDDGTYTVVNGIKGDTGATGATGATGRTATITIGSVTTGAAGSAVTLENVGTPQDAVWNLSIPKGDRGAAWYPTLDSLGTLTFALSDSAIAPPAYNIRGPQGPQGVQGATGAKGEQGPQGVQGTQGPQGAAGPQGAVGPAGPQGAHGPQGEKGDDGADGNSFMVKDLFATLAALKVAHPTGSAGDAYAVGTAADNVIYLWGVDQADWRDIGALQGPQGPQGPAGAQGPIGPQGDTGAQGPQGVQGIQGPQGTTGAQGSQGIQGSAGADGKSAYASATSAGYTGTETAFNASLAGIDNKADKKVPTAAGNLATLDSAGNLGDSGKKPGDLAAASHTHTKSQITDFPTSMTPTAHKSTHATGGTDALTATDIGAAAVSHIHGNLTSDGKIGGVALDTKLVQLVSGALTTLDGTAVSGGLWTKLAEFTTASGNPVNIDISSAVWDRTKYSKLKICFDACVDTNVDEEYLYMRFNSVSSNRYLLYRYGSNTNYSTSSSAIGSINLGNFGMSGALQSVSQRHFEIDVDFELDTINSSNYYNLIAFDCVSNQLYVGGSFEKYHVGGMMTNQSAAIVAPQTMNLMSGKSTIYFKNITLLGCR